MYGFENGTGALPWEPTEETVLLLAREQEWAEAYVADHPNCQFGQIYLDFLHREMVQSLGEL